MPHFSMNLIFSCDVFNISLFVLLTPYRVQLMDLQGRKRKKERKEKERGSKKINREEEKKKKKKRKKTGRKKKDRKEEERNTLIRRKEILTMQYTNKSNCILRSPSFFNLSKKLNNSNVIQNNKREIE